MMTDTTRLQQVLKNLLSNAFKFTTHGQVSLVISLVTSGFTSDHPTCCMRTRCCRLRSATPASASRPTSCS
jgi:signal transduction histidine kinase